MKHKETKHAAATAVLDATEAGPSRLHAPGPPRAVEAGPSRLEKTGTGHNDRPPPRPTASVPAHGADTAESGPARLGPFKS